jgi:hypothetical protein
MTENHDQPDVDDVIDPVEQPHPDHHAHAKTPKHVDDDELQERTELEADQVGGD